jgi:hypothetical protein
LIKDVHQVALQNHEKKSEEVTLSDVNSKSAMVAMQVLAADGRHLRFCRLLMR